METVTHEITTPTFDKTGNIRKQLPPPTCRWRIVWLRKPHIGEGMRNHHDLLGSPAMCRQFALLTPIHQPVLVAAHTLLTAFCIRVLQETRDETVIAAQR